MNLRRVTELLVTLYLWGFLLYNLLPAKRYETWIVKEELAPRPFVTTVYYYFGLRAYDSRSLEKVLREKGIDLVYGFFEEKRERLLPIEEVPGCRFIFLSEVPLLTKLGSFFFEFLPLYWLSEEYYTYHYHVDPAVGKCNILFFDNSLKALSGLLGEFRTDFSKNFVYRRVYEEVKLERNVILNGKEKVEVYAFSTRSFYFPGESTVNEFRLYVRTNLRRSLILIYREKELYRVYDADSVVVRITEPGTYSVKVLSYRFNYKDLYLGLRLVAYSSPVTLSRRLE